MSARILIVEDDPASLELARYLLDSAGYETLSATDGGNGVELALGTRPDLVVCDLQMPVLTGFDVVRRLQQDPDWRRVPIVAVSAFSMRDRSRAGARGGLRRLPVEADHARVVRRGDRGAPAGRVAGAAGLARTVAERRMAKVLVVDDNAANRELVVTLLKYRGHEPLQAADGADALDVVRAERPSLVISDVLMPTMDGYEFVRLLRADPALAATEVVFYTAHYRERDARNLARACGVSRVLVKPCEPEDILAAIDGGLSEPHEAVPPPVEEAFDREHLRLVADKLAEKVSELGATNARLAALSEINLQLASELDSNVLLEKVCRSARDLIGARYAILCVKARKAGDPVFFTTSGVGPAFAAVMKPPRVDGGPLGPGAPERRSRRFDNPGGDPIAAGLPPGFPRVRACLAAPVASLKSVYGWICLGDKLGGSAFSDEDERLLSIMAAQVGRVYENGILYHEVRHHATRLQAEVTERKIAEVRIQRQNRVYAMLSGINALIVRVRDRDELARRACRLAVDEGRFQLAWIGWVDPRPARSFPARGPARRSRLPGSPDFRFRPPETRRRSISSRRRSKRGRPWRSTSTGPSSAFPSTRDAGPRLPFVRRIAARSGRQGRRVLRALCRRSRLLRRGGDAAPVRACGRPVVRARSHREGGAAPGFEPPQR